MWPTRGVASASSMWNFHYKRKLKKNRMKTKNNLRTFSLCMLLSLLGFACSKPATYEDALKLYEAGDYQKAIEMLVPMCEGDDSLSQKLLVLCYDQTKQYEEALKCMLPLAEKGECDMNYLAGQYYANGWGTVKDLDKALECYREAGRHGNIQALVRMGAIYAEKHDNANARKCYQIAAEQGDVSACFLYGYYLYEGIGGEADKEEGLKWLKKAQEKGDQNADKFLKEHKL